MTKTRVRPVIIVLFYMLSLMSLMPAYFALFTGDLIIVLLSVAGSSYLIYKAIKLKNEKIAFDENSFIYAGKLYPLHDVIEISRFHEEKNLTRNYKIYLLGNSSIYYIKTKSENIQILGKLYTNADEFMAGLSSAASIELIDL